MPSLLLLGTALSSPRHALFCMGPALTLPGTTLSLLGHTLVLLGWDIPGEQGSQDPTKSSDSHEIFAAFHTVLAQI